MFEPLKATVISRIKDKTVNSKDLVEAAHNESPHLDLCCLQIQSVLFLML